MNRDEREGRRGPLHPDPKARKQSGNIGALKPKQRQKYKVCLMNDAYRQREQGIRELNGISKS